MQLIQKHSFKILVCLTSFLVLSSFLIDPPKKTLFIIGDSTVQNTTSPTGMWGWGSVIGNLLDTTNIQVSNQAKAGRSTRTFVKEGRWDKTLAAIQPGDYLIMQFGHNEGSKPDTSKSGYRGVLKGIDNDSVSLTWADGSIEVVHSYGWYLAKFVQEAKAKGAIPIIASMIPRNEFKEGKVIRADNNYGKWAADVARLNGAFFVDLNAITADKYDAMGPEKVKPFFPIDHTHTTEAGARINAASVIEGLQKITSCTLNKYVLSTK